MRAELVVSALVQALKTRNPSAGTIFHSDRGSQYGSNAFRALLGDAGLQQSMSARANPYDNAFTESFIGTLKAELVDDEHSPVKATPTSRSSTTSMDTTTPSVPTPRSATKAPARSSGLSNGL